MIDHIRLNAQAKRHEITQAELARRVGMSQQAMWKLFSGHARSSRYLPKIARELGTSPEYLTGETDDADTAAILPTLSYDQRQLLSCFEALQAEDRQLLLAVAKRMAGPDFVQLLETDQ